MDELHKPTGTSSGPSTAASAAAAAPTAAQTTPDAKIACTQQKKWHDLCEVSVAEEYAPLVWKPTRSSSPPAEGYRALRV